MNFIYIAITVACTVYGQLVLKWQMQKAGFLPANLMHKIGFLLSQLFNPWIISVFVAAAVAAFSWMAVMTKLQLSYAYPFVSVSFGLVLLLSAYFFNEPLTLPKVIGVLLITAGVAISSQG